MPECLPNNLEIHVECSLSWMTVPSRSPKTIYTSVPHSLLLVPSWELSLPSYLTQLSNETEIRKPGWHSTSFHLLRGCQKVIFWDITGTSTNLKEVKWYTIYSLTKMETKEKSLVQKSNDRKIKPPYIWKLNKLLNNSVKEEKNLTFLNI